MPEWRKRYNIKNYVNRTMRYTAADSSEEGRYVAAYTLNDESV